MDKDSCDVTHEFSTLQGRQLKGQLHLNAYIMHICREFLPCLYSCLPGSLSGASVCLFQYSFSGGGFSGLLIGLDIESSIFAFWGSRRIIRGGGIEL